MKIIKKSGEIVTVEIDSDDITSIHCGLYSYRRGVEGNEEMAEEKKQVILGKLNELIELFDSLV